MERRSTSKLSPRTFLQRARARFSLRRAAAFFSCGRGEERELNATVLELQPQTEGQDHRRPSSDDTEPAEQQDITTTTTIQERHNDITIVVQEQHENTAEEEQPADTRFQEQPEETVAHLTLPRNQHVRESAVRRLRARNWVSDPAGNRQHTAQEGASDQEPAGQTAEWSQLTVISAFTDIAPGEEDHDFGAEEERSESLQTYIEGHNSKSLVPALISVQASVSSGSQAGQNRELSVSAYSGKVGVYLASKSGKTEDSDPQAPVRAEGSLDPWEGEFEPESGVFLEPDEQTTVLQTETETVHINGLAYHRQTGRTYVLVKSNSGIKVLRLIEGGQETDLSFVISQESTNASIAVLGKEENISFMVVSVPGKLLEYDLYGVKQHELITSDTIEDIAAATECMNLYCLLASGDVVEYHVPGLERIREVKPPRQITSTRAVQISSCSESGKVVILFIGKTATNLSAVANIYDKKWTLLCSVDVRPKVHFLSLSLQGEDLLIGWTQYQRMYFYYINYQLSAAALLCIDNNRVNYNSSFNICPTDEDHAMFASDNVIQRSNMSDIRKFADKCTRTDAEISVRDDLPGMGVQTELLFSCNEYYSTIGINRGTGELLTISSSGHVTVYGRDVTRPVHNYSLPVPDRVRVKSFDTTDEGEIVAVSEDGMVMIFSLDRRQYWNIPMNARGRDVVCSEDKLYVLLETEIIIYTHQNGQTELSRCIPIKNAPYEKGSTLAVHGDTLYLLIPTSRHVLRMKLADPEPFFTIFLITIVSPRCLAVTGSGEVVIDGVWGGRSGTVTGLRVFSTDGLKVVRRVKFQGQVAEVALLPGGGAYVKTKRLHLHFIEHI